MGGSGPCSSTIYLILLMSDPLHPISSVGHITPPPPPPSLGLRWISGIAPTTVPRYRKYVLVYHTSWCHQYNRDWGMAWVLLTPHVDVFVKHGCTWQQESQNLAKSRSPTFWPPPCHRGMTCDVREVCQQPLTSPSLVTVWRYEHPNFKHWHTAFHIYM